MSDLEQEPALEEIEAELPRTRWSGKRLVLIAVPLLLLGGGGAAFAFMGDEEKKPAVDVPPTYVEVPEMMVNLRGPDGRTRYLKLRVMLEVSKPEDAPLVTSRLPAVVDGFQSFLRELSPNDLVGSAGSFRVKEELLLRVNQATAPVHVDDVLIQELIQQ